MSKPLASPLNVPRFLRPALAALVLLLASGALHAAEGELEVPPDLNALRAMAESGQAKAQTELADILAGNGDFTNAVTWYRKAAQQGEVASQLTLATLLITGRGTAKNPREAAHWLRAAADRIEGVPPKATNALIITKTNAPVLAATNATVAVVTNARPPAPPNTPKVPRADILQPAAPTLQDVRR